jgi:hypothetical protein
MPGSDIVTQSLPGYALDVIPVLAKVDHHCGVTAPGVSVLGTSSSAANFPSSTFMS